MIPKIIHTFWGGEKNIREISYLDNWEEIFLPAGYEIKVWKPEDFDLNENSYIKETYELKQWAHMSDYIRLKVLYEHGGFWLDTDVKVFKTFDELLELDYVMSTANICCSRGKQYHKLYHITKNIKWLNRYPRGLNKLNILDNPYVFSAGVFGFTKGHVFLKKVLDEYNKSYFRIREVDGVYDLDIAHYKAKAIHNNNIKLVFHVDIVDSCKDLVDMLKDKKYDENINNVLHILPPIMFECKDEEESYHPLMFASHKHKFTWLDSSIELHDKMHIYEQ